MGGRTCCPCRCSWGGGGRAGGGEVKTILGAEKKEEEEGGREEECVLPDLWSIYRVPLEMYGYVGAGGEAGREGGMMGGLDLKAIMRVDLKAIMRVTMEERKGRGRGGVESESSGE